MGEYSGLEFYERYHFADYKRSLKRGIGVCGDHSMILSEILREKGIQNSIVAFDGHVVVEANIEGSLWTLDPDFGVVIKSSFQSVKHQPGLIKSAYGGEGYSDSEIRALVSTYVNGHPKHFDGVRHFITKRYYFEQVSYYLIWLIPVLLILLAIYIRNKAK